MTGTPDVLEAAIALLAADAGVAALAGARVYGGELPKAEAASQAMPRHAVVLQPSGGVNLLAGATADLSTQRLDAFAYGSTPHEARRLGRAVQDAFKPALRVVFAGCLVHWVEPAGGWLQGRDPDTDWPLVWQSFQAAHSDIPIAS